MEKRIYNRLLLFTLSISFCNISFTQKNEKQDTVSNVKTIAAGAEYNTSSFHQWLWGKNYRKEWATPVAVPVFYLDENKGGLHPVKAGGGHQTKSLHLETKDEKEYTLRTVNKTLGKVLPKNFQETFIEDMVNDKVSMSHPYGAAGVPFMAEKAGIFHTNPRYVYLPNQHALDTFSNFAGKLYLFEQRVDGNWKEADNLGNFEKYIGTDKLLKKIYDDNDVFVDQQTYIKARLFDMLINDWDRHEDQWEWGETKSDKKTTYTPVPQDRDQAFFTYNGVLLKLLMGASGMKYFQPFKNNLPDVTTFNYEERNLDRFFANQMTLNDWQAAARQLQTSLTDQVIETSIKNLPSNIYEISGPEIVSKIRNRRNSLVDIATNYYNFIAKEVDIVGSKKHEQFEIKTLPGNETSVNIFKISKEGKVSDKPLYSRVFKQDETREIRLYGLSGNDIFKVDGNTSNNIKVRLIGGDEKDHYQVTGSKIDLQVYDDSQNDLPGKSQAHLHLSSDSSIHAFKYNSYLYDKHGIAPTIFYSDEDRLFVGLGYSMLKNKWRKEPFASKQKLQVNYSLSQKAPSVTYTGLFPSLIGKWDMSLLGNYDAVRWTNFFGLGNQTNFDFKEEEINYYRARTEEWLAKVTFTRKIARNTFNLSGFYQSVRLINDEDRFIAKSYRPTDTSVNEVNKYGGAQLQYTYGVLNDSVVPTKGFFFIGNAAYINNLQHASTTVGRYSGHLQLYVPLPSKFSLALRVGATTVSGDPAYYQYASIGGGQTVRGFRRDRFWGKTGIYNSNELRYISKVKNYYFNGKAGILAFFDNGRVWMPSEKSDAWHVGYGAGIILSPFDKILADVTYGISKDERIIQLRLSTPLH